MFWMCFILFEFVVRVVSEFIGGSDWLFIMLWIKIKYMECLKLKLCDDNDGVLYFMWLY